MANLIEVELKEFVEKFKNKNNRIPTQTEIAKGTGRNAKTIKSYLTVGLDFAKPLTNQEAAKLGGPKLKGPLKADKKLIAELKKLTVKGVSPYVATRTSGSKAFRVRFDKKLNIPEIGGIANAETLKEIKDTVNKVTASDNYTKNILPFQTSAETKAFRKFQRNEYKKKDPFNIYQKLQDYKRKKFPDLSYDQNIQHGQSKFSTQTLSRFGLLPRSDNVEGPIKNVERLRDNNLKTTLATLDNPNASVLAKKQTAEKYNSIVKGLRGQLKGTNVQGFVNFETFDVDDKGNYKKTKDIGFDPKKGMAFKNKLGDLDFSKITKEKAEEIVKLGKKKIDFELIQKTTDVTTADKIPVPEKTKTMNMFKNAFKTIGKAKTAIPAAALTAFATSSKADDPTYNSEIGAIVKPGTDEIESQSSLLDWTAANPEPLIAASAIGGAGLTTAGNTMLKGLLKTLAAPAAGVANAAYEISENLEGGDNILEAVADKTAGLGLMGSSAFSSGLGSLLGGAKLARSLTPVGAAMTAAGLGKDYYEFAQDEIEKMDAMSDYDRGIYNDMLMDDTNIDF